MKWHERELPILRYTSQRMDEVPGSLVDTSDIAAHLDLDRRTVEACVRNLQNAGYFTSVVWDGGGGGTIMGVSERTLREVDIWPKGDPLQDLLKALHDAEETATSPEEKTRVRKVIDAVSGASREVMVDVMASVIARQSGLG